MATETMEERLAALEAEVARLKAQARGECYGVIVSPKIIEEMFGVFAGDAEAEAVPRSIEEAREKEREEARLTYCDIKSVTTASPDCAL